MSKRSRQEEESSLELLLDTMCNTFGGVMFIAISIFVIISGMTQIEQKQEKTEPVVVDAEALQHELVVLQHALEELQKKMAVNTEELQMRQSINAQNKIEEVAMLEKVLTELKQQLKTMQTANRTVEHSRLQTEQALKSLQMQLQNVVQQREKLEAENLQQSKELARLKQQIVPQHKIVFKILEPSSEAPFFIMLRGEYAYAVGPDENSNSPAPLPPVKYSTLNNGRTVVCEPIEDKGVKVLHGDKLSSEFRQLLNSIPTHRVPSFFIPPGSARTAYKLREELKKRNITHGFSTTGKDSDPFTYVYTDNVEYEY